MSLGVTVPLSSEDEAGSGVAAVADAVQDPEQYFIKCQHCHKGYPGFQALNEHVEREHPSAHPAGLGLGSAVLNGGGSPTQGSAASPPLTPTPSTASSNGILAASAVPLPLRTKGGGHACAQCNSAFSTRDQLEKHELVHSPNIQVVSRISSCLIS